MDGWTTNTERWTDDDWRRRRRALQVVSWRKWYPINHCPLILLCELFSCSPYPHLFCQTAFSLTKRVTCLETIYKPSLSPLTLSLSNGLLNTTQHTLSIDDPSFHFHFSFFLLWSLLEKCCVVWEVRVCLSIFDASWKGRKWTKKQLNGEWRVKNRSPHQRTWGELDFKERLEKLKQIYITPSCLYVSQFFTINSFSISSVIITIHISSSSILFSCFFSTSVTDSNWPHSRIVWRRRREIIIMTHDTESSLDSMIFFCISVLLSTITWSLIISKLRYGKGKHTTNNKQTRLSGIHNEKLKGHKVIEGRSNWNVSYLPCCESFGGSKGWNWLWNVSHRQDTEKRRN